MREVDLENLEPGMVIADLVISKQGQIILHKGTVLTHPMISRLEFYRIESVMIEDPIVEDEEPQAKEPPAPKPPAAKPVSLDSVKDHKSIKTVDEMQSSQSKFKTTEAYQQFQTNYSNNIVSMQRCFEDIIAGMDAYEACQKLLAVVAQTFSNKTSLDLFNMIHSIRAVDDLVYAHSVNTALITRAIGKWLKLSSDDLNTLTMAGLLHDIGKTQISNELLGKTGALTDEEFNLIRSHSKKGYQILKNTNLDTRIKLTALQHHERYDESGYPHHLDGDEIDFFASIVAIADVYDAMTSARSYRQPRCAFQVMYEFEQEGFSKYNPKVIYTFLKRVANCYINQRVILNDGTPGRVVFINTHSYSRPMIELDSGDIIDLASPSNKDYYINRII